MRNTHQLPPAPWMGPSPSWDVPSAGARRARVDSLRVTLPPTGPEEPVPPSVRVMRQATMVETVLDVADERRPAHAA